MSLNFALNDDDMNDCKTPLYSAVKEGRIEVAQILLDAHANVNAKDVSVMTPLNHIKNCELVNVR